MCSTKFHGLFCIVFVFNQEKHFEKQASKNVLTTPQLTPGCHSLQPKPSTKLEESNSTGNTRHHSINIRFGILLEQHNLAHRAASAEPKQHSDTRRNPVLNYPFVNVSGYYSLNLGCKSWIVSSLAGSSRQLMDDVLLLQRQVLTTA